MLANGAINAAAADGAGITIYGANATITYVNATNSWNLNKDIISLKFLVNFFNLSTNQRSLSVYSYFFEMCLLRKTLENNIFINLSSKNIYFSYVIKHIIKPNIEDAYQANYFKKNSLNMFKRSKEIRTITTIVITILKGLIV